MPRKPALRVVQALLAGMVLVLAGCAGGENSGDGPYEMRITSSAWPIMPFSVPTMVAMDKGYFADENIKIKEVVTSDGGGTTVRNLLSGDLDMGLVAFSAALTANTSGAPVVAVGGGPQQTPGYGLVAAANSPIRDLDDAIDSGVKIGYSAPGSATEGVLALALKKRGVDPAKANTASTGGAGAGMTFVRSAQDFSVSSIVEPLLALDPDGLKEIYTPYDDGIRDYQQAVWVTRPQFIGEHSEVISGFLRAQNKAIDDIAKDVPAAAKLWAEKEEIPEDVALATLRQIEQTSGITNYFGKGFSTGPISATVEGMIATDALSDETSVDWAQFINQDFLDHGIEKLDLAKLPNAAEQ